MKIAAYILGGLIFGYALWQGARIYYYGRVSQELVARAEVRGHSPAEPSRSVLIVGDSLWAGVGAADPADSLAGRLIADLPDALVVNRAESGARIVDGLAQLATARKQQAQFDQVIIQLGANDIVNLTNLSAAKRDLRRLLRAATDLAPDVAYLVSGSVGFAPLFLQPLDWFYTAVTRRYLTDLSAVAREEGVLYIDLFRQRANDPFYQDPDRFYARDKFHPSAAGYGLWYQKCRQELQCFTYN